MFITGVGTANPPRQYRQQECWQTLSTSPRFQEFAPRSRAILKKVLTGDSGIATRHLAVEHLDDAFTITPDALHARFLAHAPGLAIAAAQQALAAAKTGPEEIDAVLISTCTGYLCPGLTSYASEGLSLRPDVLALDLVGQGCGAALPNLQTAAALIASGHCQNVLSICVEVCSAAFYLDDDAGVLISACLFGDGAAAAVLSRTARGGRRSPPSGIWIRGPSVFRQAGRALRGNPGMALARFGRARQFRLVDQRLLRQGGHRLRRAGSDTPPLCQRRTAGLPVRASAAQSPSNSERGFSRLRGQVRRRPERQQRHVLVGAAAGVRGSCLVD